MRELLRNKSLGPATEQAERRCRDWGEKAGEPEKVPARVVLDEKGVSVIAGANTKVVEIVAIRQSYAETPEEIAEGLPHLTLEQVKAALDYYEAHKQEIDDDMERRIQSVERLREEMGQPEIVKRLRKPN